MIRRLEERCVKSVA